MRKWRKRGIVVVACLVATMAIAGTVDCMRALAFERPIFARPWAMADDGGSGIYQGLGYSVEIRGIFLAVEEEPRGVTETTINLFGIPIVSAARN